MATLADLYPGTTASNPMLSSLRSTYGLHRITPDTSSAGYVGPGPSDPGGVFLPSSTDVAARDASLANTSNGISAIQQIPSSPYQSMTRTGVSSVQAPQQLAPGNQSVGSPATNSVSQVGQSNASAQQLAIANAINQYLAQQAAAKKAAYDSSVPGQTQNMIDNRGVFAGRQAAAPASSTAPPALPQLQTTQGLRPMGGV